MKQPAVFLDKDGTLVENVPYSADPVKMRLCPGAAEGIRMLGEAGFRLFVVSNQSGVARGHFGEHELVGVEARLRTLMGQAGVKLDAFYYCPHHPEGSVAEYSLACDCRKPEPGMILNAGRDHAIDLAGSWLIGDILDDVEAGRRAGCRTILIDNGHETEWRTSPDRTPDHVAANLIEAAEIILSASQPLSVAAVEGSTRRVR
ncbi:MAG TPA: HAD family hydrolase [Actinomycetota bacterium]|nr:HAD family hydrolase [Actinomycetota bacterium]